VDEAVITKSLMAALNLAMPGGVGFKHFDVSTDGIPDISFTWAKRTLWVEVKYGEGEIRPGQLITMRRLGQTGIAYYVRFGFRLDGSPRTVIGTPFTFKGKDVLPPWETDGHDVRKVAAHLRSKMLEKVI